MRNQIYPPPPPPPCGKSSLTLRKHLRRFVFAAAVLFILAACEPPGPPVTPPADKSFTTTVSGTVTVTEKGVSTALKGVNVSALVDKKVVKTVQTDAGGKYSLVVTHKGSFTLSIRAAGYVGQSLPIKTKERTLTRNIALVKAVASTTVRGKVTAPDGTALKGVSISVKDRPEISPVTTGADGNYRNLVVPHSGSFTLTASKNGYAEKTAALTTRNTSAVQDFTLTLIGTLAFESPQIRKSKMLVITNPNPAASGTYMTQTYTNKLLYEGKAVTAGVVYSITGKPAGITNEITVDPTSGEVSFGKPLYDKMTPPVPPSATVPPSPVGPQTVTVQAAYQGKTASYTFTVTDHFSPRRYHSSVVLDSDIYVIGGEIRSSRISVGAPITTAIQSNEVWRSGDGGLTWDQVAGAGSERFPDRNAHGSVVLGNDIYVIAGLGGGLGTSERDDVWKSSNKGKSWTRTAAGVTFPMDDSFASAVLNNIILIMGGVNRTSTSSSDLNDIYKSSNGASWSPTRTAASPGTVFSPRSNAGSVVLGSGSAAEVYLIGGYQSAVPAAPGTPAVPAADLNDVWKSGDGVSWTHVNRTIPATTTPPTPAVVPTKFPVRSGHTAVAVKDAAGGDILYVIGGRIQGSNQKRDVWKSVDRGVNWTRVTAGAQFGGRSSHSSVVLDGVLYVIGGDTAGRFYNDVWKSADGATWENVHKN